MKNKSDTFWWKGKIKLFLNPNTLICISFLFQFFKHWSNFSSIFWKIAYRKRKPTAFIMKVPLQKFLITCASLLVSYNCLTWLHRKHLLFFYWLSLSLNLLFLLAIASVTFPLGILNRNNFIMTINWLTITTTTFTIPFFNSWKDFLITLKTDCSF